MKLHVLAFGLVISIGFLNIHTTTNDIFKEGMGPLSIEILKYKKGIISLEDINFCSYLNKPAPNEKDTRTTTDDIKTANMLFKSFNNNWSLIHLMAFCGNKEALRTLLEIFPDGLSLTNDAGNIPLHYLILNNSFSLLEFCLYGQRQFTEGYKFINHSNLKNESLLKIAIDNDAVECVEILLNYGFFVNEFKNTDNYVKYAQKLYINGKNTSEERLESLKKIVKLLKTETNLIGIIKKYFMPLKMYNDHIPLATKLIEYLANLTINENSRFKDLKNIIKAEKLYKKHRVDKKESFGDIINEALRPFDKKKNEYDKLEKKIQSPIELDKETKNPDFANYLMIKVAQETLKTIGYNV